MKLRLAKPLSTIQQRDGELLIVLPVKRLVRVLVFFPVFLAAWLSFGPFVARAALTSFPRDLFFSAAFLAWVFGFVYVLQQFLWRAWGKEIVRVTYTALSIQNAIFGRGAVREFPIRDVKRLRVAPDAAHWNRLKRGLDTWVGEEGAIAFDAGAKTYRFGRTLEESEARDIVNEIEEYAVLLGTGTDSVAQSSRIEIRNLGDLEIQIPPPRDLQLVFTAGIFTLVWLSLGVNAYFPLIHGRVNTPYPGIWLFWAMTCALWLAISALQSFLLLWEIWGTEVIRVGPRVLRLESRILGFGWERMFELSRVTGLRVYRYVENKPLQAVTSQVIGLVEFDYGDKRIHFGRRIQEAEAFDIIERIRSRQD